MDLKKGYPADWNEIAMAIKRRDGFKCQRCSLQFVCDTEQNKVMPSRDNNGKMQSITVHHLNRIPSDCSPENLISLCGRCHCQVEWPLIHLEQFQSIETANEFGSYQIRLFNYDDLNPELKVEQLPINKSCVIVVLPPMKSIKVLPRLIEQPDLFDSLNPPFNTLTKSA